MKIKVKFSGRKNGAIGVFYTMVEIIEVDQLDVSNIVEELNKKYELNGYLQILNLFDINQ